MHIVIIATDYWAADRHATNEWLQIMTLTLVVDSVEWQTDGGAAHELLVRSIN